MIHFLIGLILVGFLIMMMVAYPAFRNSVLFILIAGGIGLWALIDSSNKQSREYQQKQEAQQAALARQRDAQQQAALAAFNAGQIKIQDAKLKPASYGMGEFVLEGTAVNDAIFPLDGLRFEVTITDCQSSTCRIVGQQGASASVNVPPGQARAFSTYAIKFVNLPAVGTNQRSWVYKVTALN